ncbi:peptidase, partial [Staphylococcus pseudintermedius]|nr:peptidase [Staphylococcus pseudintermedius]EIE3624243.1 peptidase [Staphylococcus pseudintermedius]
YLQKNIIIIFENEVTVVLILYFLVSVFLHELGHIYSLKFFGRKIDKFGFRLNFYVFPSFYVQMNETYMLSKIDKIIVHSFGLFINIISINLLQLMNILIIDSYALTVAYMFFSSTLLWNLVPILNSDGYKIMMVALSLDEFNNFTKNHWLILIFQTIGVVIALNTIIHWVFYWIKNISI